MINPFVLDYPSRLAAWKACRQQIQSHTTLEQQLDTCLEFWRQAPLENHLLNWDDAPGWPTAWEMLSNNCYCTSTHSLGIAYTLMLAVPELENQIHLKLITDKLNCVQKIVVQVQDWILNYGFVDKTPVDRLQHVHTSATWRYTGKQWQQT